MLLGKLYKLLLSLVSKGWPFLLRLFLFYQSPRILCHVWFLGRARSNTACFSSFSFPLRPPSLLLYLWSPPFQSGRNVLLLPTTCLLFLYKLFVLYKVIALETNEGCSLIRSLVHLIANSFFSQSVSSVLMDFFRH